MFVHKGAIDLRYGYACVFSEVFHRCSFCKVDSTSCFDDFVFRDWHGKAVSRKKLRRGMQRESCQDAAKKGVVDSEVFGTVVLSI